MENTCLSLGLRRSIHQVQHKSAEKRVILCTQYACSSTSTTSSYKYQCLIIQTIVLLSSVDPNKINHSLLAQKLALQLHLWNGLPIQVKVKPSSQVFAMASVVQIPKILNEVLLMPLQDEGTGFRPDLFHRVCQ